MPRCFLRLCSRSVEPLCGKPWLDGSGCSLLLIGVVEPSSWDFRLVQFPEVQKQLKNLAPCHFCPTEANFYHGMVWALVQKNGQKHASGFRRKPANTNGSRALIWRTSTRSYLTCLFLCAGTFDTKFFCLCWILPSGWGLSVQQYTCSVSRMSWTCTYRGSVWGKTHTHTHTPMMFLAVITWLHMRILRTLGLHVWFFPVGQLCIGSECSRGLRKPDACSPMSWADWCEKMCCGFWARFCPSCLSTTSLMSADVSRGKTWWVLAPYGMTYPNHHVTLWPSSHRATNNHFTTNICLFWFPCFVDPIPIELLAHLLFIRLLFESSSTRQRGGSYHQKPVEKSSMLHHVLPKYHR